MRSCTWIVATPDTPNMLAREVTESHTVEEDLGVMADEKLNMSRQCALLVQRWSPGLHQEQWLVVSGR